MSLTRDKLIVSFKSGSMAYIIISIIFLSIAIIVPIYFYPHFFLSSFINLLPYPVITAIVIAYDILKYRRYARIEIFQDRIRINSAGKTTSILIRNIDKIERVEEMRSKLYIIKTKNGMKIGIFDRRLFLKGKTIIQILNELRGTS